MPFRGIPWPNTTPRGNRPVQQEREVCVKRHKRISSGKGGSDLLRGRGERSHKRTLQIGFPWARGEEQGREISQSLEKGAKIIAVSDADQFACIITCCIITKKKTSHILTSQKLDPSFTVILYCSPSRVRLNGSLPGRILLDIDSVPGCCGEVSTGSKLEEFLLPYKVAQWVSNRKLSTLLIKSSQPQNKRRLEPPFPSPPFKGGGRRRLKQNKPFDKHSSRNKSNKGNGKRGCAEKTHSSLRNWVNYEVLFPTFSPWVRSPIRNPPRQILHFGENRALLVWPKVSITGIQV